MTRISAPKRLQPLSDFLAKHTSDLVTLRLAQIEEIIGDQLPEYAKSGFGFWANSESETSRHRRAYAWLDNRYKAFVDEGGESITFKKMHNE